MYNSNIMMGRYAGVAIKEQAAQTEYNRAKLNESYEESKKIREARENFLNTVRESLVVESLNTVLESSLTDMKIDVDHKKFGKDLIQQFVREEGAINLINKFKTSSQLLAEMAIIIESSYKSIVEKVDSCANPTVDSYRVMPSESKEFFDKISGLPLDKVSKEIDKRVVSATEDFVKSNLEDKENMEKLASDVKEKIDNVKAKDEDTENAIKQEMANYYKTKVYSVENYKPRGVFETMVNISAKKLISDPTMLEAACGGKFDIDVAIKNATVSYTFLEMVNTMNIKKVDEAYLKSLLIQ